MRSSLPRWVMESRVRTGPMASDDSLGMVGAFVLRGPTRLLNVVAADGETTGWDHVSVSVNGSHETPTWDEMCFIKGLWFSDDECVVQYHPVKADYINHHPGVLHMWRRVGGFPMPSKECV